MMCPKCGYRRWVTDGPVRIVWLQGPCPNDGLKLVPVATAGREA